MRSRPQKWLGSSATPGRPSTSSGLESTGSLQDSYRCRTVRKFKGLALQFFHLFSVSGFMFGCSVARDCWPAARPFLVLSFAVTCVIAIGTKTSN